MAFPPYTVQYAALYPFTSEAEIQRLLSFKGQIHHLDDLDIQDDNYEPGTSADATDTNFLSELIERVTGKMMEYLAPRFEASALYRLPRIREIATYWACHDLSRRRGNEPIFENEYAEGIDTLERYREGSLYLNAVSSGPRVHVQAYVTDSRFTRNPTRVIRGASTSTVSNQKLAWEYPFFWL